MEFGLILKKPNPNHCLWPFYFLLKIWVTVIWFVFWEWDQTENINWDYPISQRCVLPVFFRWIYYCHSSKSTGKETGKMHLCAPLQHGFTNSEFQFFMNLWPIRIRVVDLFFLSTDPIGCQSEKSTILRFLKFTKSRNWLEYFSLKNHYKTKQFTT